MNRNKKNKLSKNSKTNDGKVPDIRDLYHRSASSNKYSSIQNIIIADLKQEYFRVRYQRELKDSK